MTSSAPSSLVAAQASDLRRWRGNLQGEVDGEFVYRAMAHLERNEGRRDIYTRLADAEHRHAAVWESRLREAGAGAERPSASIRARALAFLARRFGPDLALGALRRQERVDRSHYDAQPEAVAAGLPADEREHARVLASLSAASTAGSRPAHAESRHGRIGGNALRAGVLGVNDGLVSNLSLVMGVAGAGMPREQVLLAGVAGLLAGSLAMAMGEWLSVQSARELAAHQIAIEADELSEDPQGEIEELALLYEAKGVSSAEARAMATQIIGGERQTALDAMAREELGIDPKELGGSAGVAASTSFGMFATGAIVSLLPFLVLGGGTAVVISAALSAVALFAVGAAITLITGLDPWRAGLRQMLIGLAAAAVTFAVGRLIGVSLAG